MSALLLTLGVLLLDHAADYTGHYYYAPYLMEAVVPLHFLIGPLLWGYVKVQTSPTTVKFQANHLLHLIPALLQLLVVLPFVLNGEADAKILYYYEPWFDLPPIESISFDTSCAWYRPWLWTECVITLQQVVDQSEYDLHLKSPLARIWLSDIDVMVLWASLISYIGSSVVLLKNHQSHLRQLTSNPHDKDLKWLLLFIALITVSALVYTVISFQELFFASSWLEYGTRVYVTYTLLAISVIYLGVLAILQPVIFTDELQLVDQSLTTPFGSESTSQGGKEPTEINSSVGDPNADILGLANKQTSKYRNSPLTNESALAIRASLENRLNEHKDYLNPDLSLKFLSDQLNIGPHILSQVLNESMGMSFYDCINDYRLRDAKRELRQKGGRNIMQIAMNSGFYSKSSFYSFFRKREDMTPSDWRKRFQDSEGS